MIVFENGKSGFLGEHSCMDGTPTLRLNEFVLASLAAGKVDLGPARTAETGKDLEMPQELTFVLDGNTEQLIKQAEANFEELVGKHDMEVRTFYYISVASMFNAPGPGIALRGLRQGIHQEIQDLTGRMGTAGQATRVSQDV